MQLKKNFLYINKKNVKMDSRQINMAQIGENNGENKKEPTFCVSSVLNRGVGGEKAREAVSCARTLKAEQLPEMACICLADGHFGAVFHD